MTKLINVIGTILGIVDLWREWNNLTTLKKIFEKTEVVIDLSAQYLQRYSLTKTYCRPDLFQGIRWVYNISPLFKRQSEQANEATPTITAVEGYEAPEKVEEVQLL